MTYDQNNIFAKIIRGEIPSSKIYEDEKILAFHDISRSAPVHALVIPKGEYVDFSHFVQEASAQEVDNFFKKVAEIAKKLGVEESGFRLAINKGKDGNQSVPHFHVHILGGKRMSGL